MMPKQLPYKAVGLVHHKVSHDMVKLHAMLHSSPYYSKQLCTMQANCVVPQP